jgi:hypothetical protein
MAALFDLCPTCGGTGFVPNLAAPAEGQSHTGGDETEKMAAKEVTLRTGDDRHRALTYLYLAGEEGMTDYEMAVRFDRLDRRWVPATRRGELARLGYCERTTLRRPNEKNRLVRVHRITQGGIDWINLNGGWREHSGT